MVRTLHFHCWGSRFNPWSKELRFHKMWGTSKNPKNFNKFHFVQFPWGKKALLFIYSCTYWIDYSFEGRKLSLWLGITSLKIQILHLKFKCDDKNNFPQTNFGLCTFQALFLLCSPTSLRQSTIRYVHMAVLTQSTLVFLPGKSHGQRSLAGYIQFIWAQRVGHKTQWLNNSTNSDSLCVCECV